MDWLVSAIATILVVAEGVSGTSGQDSIPQRRIIDLLVSGKPVFGVFSGAKTPQQGSLISVVRETDFVFYSMEHGPFDIPTMKSYMHGMRDGAGASGIQTHPFVLRVPAIHLDESAARQHVAQALKAGVDAVVFPHIQTPAEAAVAVDAMSEHGNLWPLRTDGDLVSILIVEDQKGVRNVHEIVTTQGVSIVFAGPGDLRRAYDGNIEAVEQAIQTVLSACLEAGIPCGITAGLDDIADRLEQGFRVIIATQVDALAIGRRVSGRDR